MITAHAQRPEFRGPHGQRFRRDFRAEKNQRQQPGHDGPKGQRRSMATHSATPTIPALAKLLPSDQVASRSCGSRQQTADDLSRARRALLNWRNCHLPSENREVSASAKKKLAAEKTTRAAKAIHAAIGVIPGTLKDKRKTRQPKNKEGASLFLASPHGLGPAWLERNAQ